MNKENIGYVYILTNPSFREDWVKIGKSSRPVDVRSKELDNTAEYQNRIYKLSPFVGTFLPIEKQTPSGAYQGAKFFSYKGKVLDELRKEKEL